MQAIDVLLISNDPAIQRLSANMLAETTYHFSSLPFTQQTTDMVLQSKNSIIIADLDDWGECVFDVIMEAKRNLQSNCRWILCARSSGEEVLYKAMKCKVDDFLRKPILPQQLSQALSESLQLMKTTFLLSASRSLFMKRGINNLPSEPMGREEINMQYGIHFQEGLYRACFLKMDCPNDVMSIFENDPLRDMISSLINKILGRFCFDIVLDRMSDGIFAILNYRTKNSDLLRKGIDELFAETSRQLVRFDGIRLTLCISKEYQETSQIFEAKMEILDARWSRMDKGIGRIICSESHDPNNTIIQREYLKRLNDEIYHAFETLNPDKSKKFINDFFHLNRQFLSTREARMFTRNLIDRLFDLYFSLADKESYTKIAERKHEFIYLTNTVNSFDQLAFVVNTQMAQVLGDISQIVSHTYSKPISEAIQFINECYSNGVSLQTVAKKVGLTTTYFSSLFKKETGQTFSDYVTNKRIAYAKELLKESKQNVTEIAMTLGYDDVRNFSKYFKKYVSISPMEYKKIYK